MNRLSHFLSALIALLLLANCAARPKTADGVLAAMKDFAQNEKEGELSPHESWRRSMKYREILMLAERTPKADLFARMEYEMLHTQSPMVVTTLAEMVDSLETETDEGKLLIRRVERSIKSHPHRFSNDQVMTRAELLNRLDLILNVIACSG